MVPVSFKIGERNERKINWGQISSWFCGRYVNGKIDFKIRGLLQIRKLIIVGADLQNANGCKQHLLISIEGHGPTTVYWLPIRYSAPLLMQSRFGIKFISNYLLEVDYWFLRACIVLGAIFNEAPAEWTRVSKQVSCLYLSLRSGRGGWWHAWADHKGARSTAPLARSIQNLKT